MFELLLGLPGDGRKGFGRFGAGKAFGLEDVARGDMRGGMCWAGGLVGLMLVNII